jgi:hypothetical protein
LLQRAGDDPAALVELDAAIDLAHRQDAKFFELRAARDRSRLLHRMGETEKAKATLLPLLDWFEEGQDLDDLKEARLLLEELG